MLASGAGRRSREASATGPILHLIGRNKSEKTSTNRKYMIFLNSPVETRKTESSKQLELDSETLNPDHAGFA